MQESSHFITPLESERVQGLQSLLKQAPQNVHPEFPLSQDKMSWKTTLLVRCEI